MILLSCSSITLSGTLEATTDSFIIFLNAHSNTSLPSLRQEPTIEIPRTEADGSQNANFLAG